MQNAITTLCDRHKPDDWRALLEDSAKHVDEFFEVADGESTATANDIRLLASQLPQLIAPHVSIVLSKPRSMFRKFKAEAHITVDTKRTLGHLNAEGVEGIVLSAQGLNISQLNDVVELLSGADIWVCWCDDSQTFDEVLGAQEVARV